MSRKYVVLLLCVTLIAAGVSFRVVRKHAKEEVLQPQAAPQWSLGVDPQKVTDRVMVKNVDMSASGWAVARAIEDGKLSQIIEISPYLDRGNHENISITLGEFYNNEDLIVMLYADNGDRVFNDLDHPAINNNGQMIARIVATGEPLPSSYTEASMEGMGHAMPGMAPMPRVRYTDNGFEPSEIRVDVGTMVEFVNESSVDMWVASNEHPEHGVLPTFDQFKPFKTGAIYRYTFDKTGSWKYHDHLKPALGGAVIVQ